jgi:hypothetical protein
MPNPFTLYKSEVSQQSSNIREQPSANLALKPHSNPHKHTQPRSNMLETLISRQQTNREVDLQQFFTRENHIKQLRARKPQIFKR